MSTAFQTMMTATGEAYEARTLDDSTVLGTAQLRDGKFTVTSTDGAVIFTRQFPVGAESYGIEDEENQLIAKRYTDIVVKDRFEDETVRLAYLRLAARMLTEN